MSAVLRSIVPLVRLLRMVRWIATKEDHAQKIMTTTVPLAIELLIAHKQTHTHTHIQPNRVEDDKRSSQSMFCVSFWECVILGSQAGRWTSILKSLATPNSFELMSWAFQQSDGLSEADYFLAQKAGTDGLWLCELGVIYS